jgi:hypothetical protein
MKFKNCLIVIFVILLFSGCSLLPSMGAGAKLAQDVAKHQAEFQKAIVDGKMSIDCAIGYSIASRTGMTSNAKLDLARANLLSVVDKDSENYKLCEKWGYMASYTMHEAEWTVQKLLEFLGTIN